MRTGDRKIKRKSMMRRKSKEKENGLFADGLSAREHMARLMAWMSEGLYEKEHIMAVALLAAIAGESLFLLGPPGTAKSMVARRLKLIFKGAKSFEYLMSRFSSPDEIFGPVSIAKLKNEDRYERLVDGYLPDAEVVFLDEVWKAGPAIQNALLTAVNERVFKNGSQTLRLPMKVLVAASNELPAEDEGLEALWDRFLVRMVSGCIRNEKTFYKMVRSNTPGEPTIPNSYLIDDALFEKWGAAIREVEITDEVCRLVAHVRKRLAELQKQGESATLDFYVSDRRWKKIFHLMQTSAFLNGRSATDATDCMLLFHCLWNKADAIPAVLDAVCSAITARLDENIAQNVKALDKLISLFSTNVQHNRAGMDGAEDDYVVMNHFYYIVEGFNQGPCLFARFDYNHVDAQRPADGILYYEEKSKNWMIHAIYTEAPFACRVTGGKITKVKLQKCRDGIMVNGTPYLFKKKDGAEPSRARAATSSADADTLFAEYVAMQDEFERLKGQFASGCNLFVSDDDINLIGKQLSKTGKALKDLGIKLRNTKLLMMR